MKVCFETFGCRLNRAEALEMEAEYLAKGWETTENHADADLFIVRGCSVTGRAEHDSLKLIEHLRSKYPNKRVIITGCLPSATKPQSANNPNSPIQSINRKIEKSKNSPFQVPTRTARAYLKVQDGCNGACSFCIVPKFRGKSVSVPFQDVVAKARAFIDAGYREIVVTGCNLAQYHSDGHDLAELLTALATMPEALSANARFRLGSVEPGPVAMRLVETMAAHANICRYLHIPIQSGSDRILQSMKRPYRARDIEELAGAARSAMPTVALACDVITGFPGESEVDFIATEGMLRRLRFSKAHVFPYSERPGTVAAAMRAEMLVRETRRERAHAAARIADLERGRFAQGFIGKTVEFVVEDEKHMSGWSSEYLWCVANSSGGIDAKARAFPRKSLARMLVKSVDGHMLIGSLV